MVRAFAVAGAASGVVFAHAGWSDQGYWSMDNNVGLGAGATKGIVNDPNWKIGSSNYHYYSGTLGWKIQQGSNIQNIVTNCSSLNQEFGGGSSFTGHLYQLYGATALGGQFGTHILMGDGIENVAIPNVDVPPETSTNFLQAAELFGHLYTTQTSDALHAAALQMAVWDTLYGSSWANPATFTGSGNGPTLSSYVAADQLALGSVSSADLMHVDWFNYEATGGNGQGQFTYNAQPAATPEPITIALGIAGLGLATRRRLARKS